MSWVRSISVFCGSATAFAFIMAAATHAHADAMVVTRAMTASTIAEVFVENEHVRAEIEIGAADVPTFVNIFPDELYEKLTGSTKPFAERQQTFFETQWVVHADGRPLRGTLERLVLDKRIVRDDITGEPLAQQPADPEIVIRLTLRYPLKDRPGWITICPSSSGNVPAANIGFVCYHNGVPVNDFRYLSGEVTLDLDWKDPWYSRFRHRNFRRQYDAPLSVFLYVESFEVRKEIVVRPKDLQQWIDLGLEGKVSIPIESQETLKQHVAEFLAKRAPVFINGQAVQGTLDRIHFIRRSLRTTGVVDPPEDLDINTAMLGVIFIHPIDGLPKTVSLTWDLFGSKIQAVPAAATDEAGGLPSILSPDDPDLRWQNHLTNPTLPAMMTLSLPE